ncbi:hypothetical protein vseg_004812 [Gypsophila vaccaria]
MELTERRNLLLLPHEQERLINEIPEVIPELSAEAEAESEDMKLDSESGKLMTDVSSENPSEREVADDRDEQAVTSTVFTGNGDLKTFQVKEQTQEIKGGDNSDKEAGTPSISGGSDDQVQESKGGNASENRAVTPSDSAADENSRKYEAPDLAANENSRKHEAREVIQVKIEGFSRATETIDLSSDDDDNDNKRIGLKTMKSTKDTIDESASAEWYCIGPVGDVRGPYQLPLLQKWKELSSIYASKFKVWRKGQKPEDGIPLPDACRLIKPDRLLTS